MHFRSITHAGANLLVHGENTQGKNTMAPGACAHRGRSGCGVRSGRSSVMRLLAAGLAASVLAGCVPVLVGGAVVGTTVVATDRRTAGMQLEDKSIDMRIRNLVTNNYSDAVQVTPSSYNGSVLLVGTVPDERTKSQIGQIARQVEHVRNVSNQLAIGPRRGVSEGANDSLITGHVRAALIGTNNLPSNAFAITTDSGVVYLQGLVTREEGDSAARVAAGMKGVTKVVKLFEYISEEEARKTLRLGGGEDASNAAPANPAGGPGTSGTSSNAASSITQSSGGAAQPESGRALAIPIPSAP